MNRAAIMRLTNTLCDYLSMCNDEEFVDRICSAVNCCDWFTDEEIEEMEGYYYE